MGAGEELRGDNVVVAPGHSARDMYQHLAALGAELQPKEFAMGFRIEHPQQLIDEAQLGAAAAALVQRGAGPVPVADYKLTARVPMATAAAAAADVRLSCASFLGQNTRLPFAVPGGGARRHAPCAQLQFGTDTKSA